MTEARHDDASHQLARVLLWYSSEFSRYGVQQTIRLPNLRLSMAQISLMYIVRQGINTPGAIARTMQVTPRAVTSVVDKLVAKQLATRSEDPVDRRVSRLALTPEGERISKEIERVTLTALATKIAELPEAERAELERSVHLMGRLLREVNEEADFEG